MLDTKKIKNSLDTEVLGDTLYVFRDIESTNTVLFGLGGEGTPDGTVVISDSQSGGRGRMNRSWFSPAGVNIYLSALLRPEISLSESAVFTFVASLALSDCMENAGISADIKWPNDLLVKGKKIAGVLTEMKPGRNNFAEFIIVGMGVNLNMPQEQFDTDGGPGEKATSVLAVSGSEVDRELFAAQLINYLEKYYIKFRAEGAYSIVATWVNRWGYMNERASIFMENRKIEGVVRKVDTSGYLYIETDDGELEKVISGDIVQAVRE